MKYSVKKRLTAMILGGLMTIVSSTALANAVDLTLEESIALALKNNQSIKISDAAREGAKWDLEAAKGAKNFSLDFTHTDVKKDNKLTGNDTNTFTNKLALSYPLYTGGQLENTIEAKKINTEIADLTLENTRQTVKLNATTGYFNILQCEDVVKVSQESVNSLQEHLKNVQAQYSVGTVAKSDVLRSEVELADAQQTLIKAQNAYALAVSNFNNVIGMPLDTEIKISDELKYDQYAMDLTECIGYALKNRPDGIAAQKAIDMQEASVDVAKAGQRPTVSASLYNTWEDDQFIGSENAGWTAGLTTTWNVFDSNVTRSHINSAKAAKLKAVETSKQTLDSIQLDVREAYLNMLEAEKRIQSSKVTVEKAQEDLKIAKVRYSAGVGTNIDVIDAQVALTQAQNNYIEALYDYNTGKATLDKAMGIPVVIE